MSRSPETGMPLARRIARRIPYLRRVVDEYHAWRAAHARTVKNITRTNTRRAYDRVYRSDSLLAEYLAPARLDFYREVAEICAPLAPRRIVDVGCGNGQLLRFLVDRMSDDPELVVGIDHSGSGIRRAQDLLPSARWIVADLYHLPPNGERFNLVLCTEVLEHVPEPARAVEVLGGLCAPGGRVAVTVPDGAHDSWEGHANFWDEDEFRAFLAPFGLVELNRIQEGGVLFAWLAPDVRGDDQP